MVGPNELPPDPITAMGEGAAAAHEMYLSYMTAGFTEDQAFALTKIVVQEAIRGLTGRG